MMQVFFIIALYTKNMQEITINKLHQLFLQTVGVCTDTRSITPQSLFVALKGENFDGNQFAQQAIANGAKYALTSKKDLADGEHIFYVSDTLLALQSLANHHRKQFNIPVIAITGSNGKTTTKELFNAVLSKKYKTLATKGNLNNHIGVPLTLLGLQAHHQLAIIEMGANHQGEIALLSRIAVPNIGLITNIGKAHLEGFGGIEGVIKGKTELYQFLINNQGKIIYNADNIVLKEKALATNTLTYGFKHLADCVGTIVKEQPFLEISYAFKSKSQVQVSSNLIGLYNAENILSAVCIGKFLEVDDKDIAEAIAAYLPDNSRSQIIKQNNLTIILDAYNANPSSMKAALDNFSKMEGNNKMVVLGDMFELGETSAIEHENIINEALKGNYVQTMFVGPRFSVFKDKYKASFFDDTASCASHLSALNLKENKLLIKGSRGMKLETLLGKL
jgi:UDP-N-acetylmuramoyl-tripeptide--D-alanyl-D-alanine ligase